MSLIADDFDTEIASFENEPTQELEVPVELVFLAIAREERERLEG